MHGGRQGDANQYTVGRPPAARLAGGAASVPRLQALHSPARAARCQAGQRQALPSIPVCDTCGCWYMVGQQKVARHGGARGGGGRATTRLRVSDCPGVLLAQRPPKEGDNVVAVGAAKGAGREWGLGWRSGLGAAAS